MKKYIIPLAISIFIFLSVYTSADEIMVKTNSKNVQYKIICPANYAFVVVFSGTKGNYNHVRGVSIEQIIAGNGKPLKCNKEN